MPDIDNLAFAIRFALVHGTISREARKAIRSLSDHDLDFMYKTVADHLRLCRWRQLPPDPIGPSAPWAKMPGR